MECNRSSPNYVESSLKCCIFLLLFYNLFICYKKERYCVNKIMLILSTSSWIFSLV